MSVGMCRDNDTALRNGPLTHRNVFCPCKPCCVLDFARCEMKQVFGSVKSSNVLRSSSTGLPTQSATLEAFADWLDHNKVVAFRVEADERGIEGNVWLGLVNGKSFELEQDERHAGQDFEKGWRVVRGHWFAHQKTAENETRIYRHGSTKRSRKRPSSTSSP